MKMQTRREGAITIIDLEGHLDFEATHQFHKTASDLLNEQSNQVVFNLSKLRFVGSSGISQFIKVLKKLNASTAKPKFCNLSSEFQKMFKAYQTARNPFQIFDDETQAVASFAPGQEPAPKLPRRKPPIAN
ncbi:STAS domain-containing protein [bacterium]|nr:STAS domain-containing protein [bacterium]